MELREARDEDIDAACAVLEAAFGRKGEARLLRALREGDALALALVAIGAPADVDPGVTMGGLRRSPSGGGASVSRAGAAGGASGGGNGKPGVTGVAVLSHLVAPKGAVGLGPLAVAPQCSDRGIGKALIGGCIERARRDGHTGIFVLGRPPYYTRFGFSVEAARPFRSEYPAEFMLALEIEEGALADGGELRYAPAFAGL